MQQGHTKSSEKTPPTKSYYIDTLAAPDDTNLDQVATKDIKKILYLRKENISVWELSGHSTEVLEKVYKQRIAEEKGPIGEKSGSSQSIITADDNQIQNLNARKENPPIISKPKTSPSNLRR